MATIIQNGQIVFHLKAVSLILMELILLQAAAKSEVLDVQSWFRSQQRLLESKPDKKPAATAPGTVAVEMIPRHHPNSPFYRPDLTRAERVSGSVRRSRARAMAMSRRLSDTFTSPGIFYQEEDYVFRVMLGTPPQKFDVVVDTGSDVCWVQCQGCNPCSNQSDPYFNRDASSTYSKVACDNALCNDRNLRSSCDAQNTCLFTLSYLAGSRAHGALSLETLTLLNSNGTAAPQDSFYFGCGLNEQVNETGPFPGSFRDVDGIFGIGPGCLSLVGQLGSAIDYKFSYCLQSDSNTNVTNRTSTLLLGSEGSLPLNYTSLSTDTLKYGLYFVEPTGISVGGVNVSYPYGAFIRGMILDSGHPLTLLAIRAYVPLLQELRKQITYKAVDGAPYGLDLCYDTSAVDPVAFPAVAFTFGNLTRVTLTPDPNANIFYDVEGDGSVYCLSFQSNSDPGIVSILGNVWQKNFQIAYDIKNLRVGFAATTCGM